MGLSREARIITLLVIDTAFFFLELTVGYAVGSLALVADSFHMLNDVLSLIVALYTIKLATSPSSSANSYGWQRAEILGALINGVFLIALCASIGVEAVGRMISPPEISSPKLIVLVGSLGLLSNIVGLFLFHDHGHSHGGGGHDHGHPHGAISLPADHDEPLHPEAEPIPRRRSDSLTFPYQHPAETRAQIIEAARLGTSYEGDSYVGSPAHHHHHRVSSSISRRKSRPLAQLKAPPQPGTNETIAPAPREAPAAITVSPPSTDATAVDEPVSPKTLPSGSKHAADANAAELGGSHDGHGHDHSHSKETPGGGHAHGSMNMRGVFLHVLGDALGNVGVIAAGLVIWHFEGKWTLYFDPTVSLLITCIIFSSAMPLVKSASKILMQGVPEHVSLEAVREAIKAVPGVVSVHDLHVWQLSETTTVASVHVLILPDKDYMEVANAIRQELHTHGIHSVTIQPEFYDGGAISDSDDDELTCLIRCPPEQCAADTCCPPTATPSQPRTSRLDNLSEGEEGSTHSHHSH